MPGFILTQKVRIDKLVDECGEASLVGILWRVGLVAQYQTPSQPMAVVFQRATCPAT